eukprot:scaffold95215_cov26-Tisochrysis_lutea.AAC.2
MRRRQVLGAPNRKSAGPRARGPQCCCSLGVHSAQAMKRGKAGAVVWGGHGRWARCEEIGTWGVSGRRAVCGRWAADGGQWAAALSPKRSADVSSPLARSEAYWYMAE